MSWAAVLYGLGLIAVIYLGIGSDWNHDKGEK